MSTPRPLTERDYQTLGEVVPSYLDEPVKAGTPLDFGGSNGSHHSATFAKLEKRGLMESKQRGGEWGEPKRWRGRGSKVYRVTPAGIAAYDAWRGKPRLTRAEGDARFERICAEAEARRMKRNT